MLNFFGHHYTNDVRKLETNLLLILEILIFFTDVVIR